VNLISQLRTARILLIEMGGQEEKLKKLDKLILETINRLMDVANEL